MRVYEYICTCVCERSKRHLPLHRFEYYIKDDFMCMSSARIGPLVSKRKERMGEREARHGGAPCTWKNGTHSPRPRQCARWIFLFISTKRVKERETSDLFHLVEAVVVCRHASVVHLLEADGDWILGTGLRTFFCCCSQMSEP